MIGYGVQGLVKRPGRSLKINSQLLPNRSESTPKGGYDQLLYIFFHFVLALNPMFFLVPLLIMGMGAVHQRVGSHLEAQEGR